MEFPKICNDNLYLREKIPVHQEAWSPKEFEEKLMALSYRYHINHPLDKEFMNGKATRELMKSWVANRFYYQTTIPRKDAALLSNCPVREVRQVWIKNITDHDQEDGGINKWLSLAEKVGLTREELLDHRHVLPGVKFACDAYYHFVKNSDWKIGIASCLTVLFACNIHQTRIDKWPEHYQWLDKEAYEYFFNRLIQAKNERDYALEFVLENFTTPEEQVRVLEVIKFKQDILWSILDNVYIYHFTDFYNGI